MLACSSCSLNILDAFGQAGGASMDTDVLRVAWRTISTWTDLQVRLIWKFRKFRKCPPKPKVYLVKQYLAKDDTGTDNCVDKVCRAVMNGFLPA